MHNYKLQMHNQMVQSFNSVLSDSTSILKNKMERMALLLQKSKSLKIKSFLFLFKKSIHFKTN